MGVLNCTIVVRGRHSWLGEMRPCVCVIDTICRKLEMTQPTRFSRHTTVYETLKFDFILSFIETFIHRVRTATVSLFTRYHNRFMNEFAKSQGSLRHLLDILIMLSFKLFREYFA